MAHSAEEARELAIPEIPDHLFKAGTNRIFVREFLDESLKQHSANRNPGPLDEHSTAEEASRDYTE
jgi:hypothetical protein